MNLFLLHGDPTISVQHYFDSHIVKIPTELAQTASNVIWRNMPKSAQQWHAEGKIYSYDKTHINHPLTKWAAAKPENYQRLLEYLQLLSDEYSYRFGEHKTHGALKHKEHFYKYLRHGKFIPNLEPEYNAPYILCMDDNYKLWPNRPVACYRYYYLRTKLHLYKYTKRDAPYWLTYAKGDAQKYLSLVNYLVTHPALHTPNTL